MNAIDGFSKLVQKPNISIEKKEMFTDVIVKSARQLFKTINNILVLSALESKHVDLYLKPNNINKLLDDLLIQFTQDANDKKTIIQLTKGISDYTAEVNTDKEKVIQILSNLISNAIKFTHEGGFVEFGVKKDECDLVFYVKDTGIGIHPDFHSKIFERFFQANNNLFNEYKGNGIGLSIVKGYIDLFGGNIWVESAPNQGSIFYFTIPYLPVYEIRIEN